MKDAFSFEKEDFRFMTRADHEAIWQKFKDLKRSLEPMLRKDPELQEYAPSLYLTPWKNQGKPRGSKDFLKRCIWIGFAGKKYGPFRRPTDAQKGVQFQYGIDKKEAAFWGIWIQGNSISGKIRSEIRAALEPRVSERVLTELRALPGEYYLWYADRRENPDNELYSGSNGIHVSELKDEHIEALRFGLRTSHFLVSISKWRDKQGLQNLRNVEADILAVTKRLLPAYSLLTGQTSGPKTIPEAPSTGTNRPEKEVQKYGFRGESTRHKLYKEYVGSHPHILGLSDASVSKVEATLVDGVADRADILFETEAHDLLVVEIELDHTLPGLYQALKYRTLLSAKLGESLNSEKVKGALVAPNIPGDVKSLGEKYNVLTFEIPEQGTTRRVSTAQSSA